MKHIYLLGSTGSIGTQTLEVIQSYPSEFKIITLTGYQNIDLLKKQIELFQPEFVSVGTEAQQNELRKSFPHILFGYGETGLVKAATFRPEDQNGLMVNGLVGIAGLVPTIETIKIKRPIALANKETLVVGGEIIANLQKQYQVKIYPIDSEHSAIWQCIRKEKKQSIEKIIITASGGAFRDLSADELRNVTVEDALKHPNWSMGNKITIDSATMMNKAFEIMEAHYLFHIPLHKIEAILHQESIVHSMVEFKDFSLLAQIASHDMILPIQYALHYPNRLPTIGKRLDLSKLSTLHFQPIPKGKYPCFDMAIMAFQKKGTYPAVVNAANEVAVSLFLQGKIPFIEIERILAKQIELHQSILHPTLQDILLIDREVRKSIMDEYI